MYTYEIINFNQLKKFENEQPLLAQQVVDMIKEHRDIEHFKLENLIIENINYKDNVRMKGKLLLMLRNNILIGMLRAEKNINKTIFISSVHIKKEYRGKKLCNKLMKYIIDYYPENTIFTLTVVDTNIPAIKCYEKFGFKIISTKRGKLNIHFMTLEQAST
jgi:ribosomal protein S18 acetylase RimI-like enzyme